MGRLIEVGLALVISLCLVYPFSAHAMRKADMGHFMVYLQDTACQHPNVLIFLKREQWKKFKAGIAFTKKRPDQVVHLCYTEDKAIAERMGTSGKVLIIDEAGNVGTIPNDMFGDVDKTPSKFDNPPANDNPRWRNDGRLWTS